MHRDCGPGDPARRLYCVWTRQQHRVCQRIEALECDCEGADRRRVPKDTIQSENQQITPVQNYQLDKLTEAQKAQRQFQVNQSWTIKMAADSAAKALDVAVKAGANQSGQIDWGFKDENAPEAEAAAKALKRARSQAEQMATSLSAKLGSLLYASNEVQPSGPRPMFRAMAAAPAMDKVQPLPSILARWKNQRPFMRCSPSNNATPESKSLKRENVCPSTPIAN